MGNSQPLLDKKKKGLSCVRCGSPLQHSRLSEDRTLDSCSKCILGRDEAWVTAHSARMRYVARHFFSMFPSNMPFALVDIMLGFAAFETPFISYDDSDFHFRTSLVALRLDNFHFGPHPLAMCVLLPSACVEWPHIEAHLKASEEACKDGDACPFLKTKEWISVLSSLPFLAALLPGVCALAARTRELFPLPFLPFLSVDQVNSLQLTRLQVGCLLCHALLDTFSLVSAHSCHGDCCHPAHCPPAKPFTMRGLFPKLGRTSKTPETLSIVPPVDPIAGDLQATASPLAAGTTSPLALATSPLALATSPLAASAASPLAASPLAATSPAATISVAGVATPTSAAHTATLAAAIFAPTAASSTAIFDPTAVSAATDAPLAQRMDDARAVVLHTLRVDPQAEGGRFIYDDDLHKNEGPIVRGICHYFGRLLEGDLPEGLIIVTRQIISKALATVTHFAPMQPTLGKCSHPLTDIEWKSQGGVEDSAGALVVDFANKNIGGGVLNGGQAQEEVLFGVTAPELLLAVLVSAPLQAHETVRIEGCLRMSRAVGFGRATQWGGPFTPAPSSSFSNSPLAAAAAVTSSLLLGGPEPSSPQTAQLTVVAMDALYFPFDYQYTVPGMLRELGKCACGFMEHDADPKTSVIATGHWGCGVFGGDPDLKFVLQWIAASCSRKRLHYYAHEAPFRSKWEAVSELLLEDRWGSWRLWRLCERYAQVFARDLEKKAEPQDFFGFLLSNLSLSSPSSEHSR